MADRLFVGILGNRKAGKSTTWNTLFGRTVRTGKDVHQLKLRAEEYVEIFLISGSPEERGLYAEDIFKKEECRIVLCSMQYVSAVQETLDYIFAERFMIYLQWLNPGFSDEGENWDKLGILNQVLSHNGLVGIRDGHHATKRILEIRDFIYGWSASRSLIYSR